MVLKSKSPKESLVKVKKASESKKKATSQDSSSVDTLKNWFTKGSVTSSNNQIQLNTTKHQEQSLSCDVSEHHEESMTCLYLSKEMKKAGVDSGIL